LLTTRIADGISWALRVLAGCCFLLIVAASPCAAQEMYTLKDAACDGRIVSVESHVTVSGVAEFVVEKAKSIKHPISAAARLKYRERQLPGAGRDAESLRSLRRYASLDVDIKVADHPTSAHLPEDRRQIVARGRREGLLFYSPQGPLSAGELEQLRAPADSLSLLGLLPLKPVAIGEKWTPATWVVQMLTDTEAASKADLTCTLESVKEGNAKVTFAGAVEGATAASTAKIHIDGWCLFNVKEGRLSHAEVQQTETRSVGPISPGMEVTAKAVVDRTNATDTTDLTEAAAAAVPLDPPPALLKLRFRAPWNVEFEHDRNWHVFQQFAEVAVLRLIDHGTFVAQCNLAPVRAGNPGEHVPEDKFQDDIRKSLGPRFTSIEKKETIPTADGRFLFRVVAVGRSNDVPMTWIYYLCASPGGAQVSFVFAVETSLRERLHGGDQHMLESLRFLEPLPPPKKVVLP
jgi:hypothetical protein